MTLNSSLIPDKIYNYKVYDNDELLIGTGEEMTLPTLEPLSNTVAGGGIMGELDIPLIGMFKSIEQEVEFNSLYSDVKRYLKIGRSADLTFRAATNIVNKETSEAEFVSMRIVERGIAKKAEFGKLKRGETMGTKATLELTYFAVYVNDEEVLVLDKLNEIYRVDGEDQLATVKAML